MCLYCGNKQQYYQGNMLWYILLILQKDASHKTKRRFEHHILTHDDEYMKTIPKSDVYMVGSSWLSQSGFKMETHVAQWIKTSNDV